MRTIFILILIAPIFITAAGEVVINRVGDLCWRQKTPTMAVWWYCGPTRQTTTTTTTTRGECGNKIFTCSKGKLGSFKSINDYPTQDDMCSTTDFSGIWWDCGGQTCLHTYKEIFEDVNITCEGN